MHICLMTIKFQLIGCGSLKEKRGRLRGLKDRFGKLANLAVSESGLHDVHQSAEWSFLVLAANQQLADQILGQVEQYAATDLDAVIADIRFERL